MDIGAYAQIEDWATIAEENGIDIPRLRGYRLMFQEQPMTFEEIKDTEQRMVLEVCRRGCRSIPLFTPESNMSEYSVFTDRIERRYIAPDKGLRWDFLHGKRRRRMKFAVKKMRKAVHMTTDAWNRYAGKEGVLYIHARIGGRNWSEYGGHDLEKQPWFLEKVDDYFDETYCDIYAKIK